jgi:hypothetical protein
VRKFILAMGLILSAVGVHAAGDAPKFGSFIGHLDLRMASDGRTAVLLAPFGYKDPAGKDWEAPRDGKSMELRYRGPFGRS